MSQNAHLLQTFAPGVGGTTAVGRVSLASSAKIRSRFAPKEGSVGLYGTISFVVGHPLNRRGKAAAALRFLRWQLGSRLVPGKVLVDWVNGTKLSVGAGESGLTGNVYCGLLEFEHMAFLLHYLREDELFVDAGSNAGSYTVLASGAVKARTVAIEPVPHTYDRLVDNVAVNGLEHRVVCHKMGLGESEQSLRFSTDADCINHVIAASESSANSAEVPVRRLDDLLDGETPLLLKVDVEGYETAVVRGAERTLSASALRAVIIELIGAGKRYGFDEELVHRVLLDKGFNTYSYDPWSRRLVPLRERNERGSTLYIRDPVVVRERIETAPRFHVHGHWI